MRQLTAERYPRALYGDLDTVIQRGNAGERYRQCVRSVNCARALKDILPDAQLYYGETGGTPDVGYRTWILAPRGPLPVQ